jgi:hypothetical protein
MGNCVWPSIEVHCALGRDKYDHRSADSFSIRLLLNLERILAVGDDSIAVKGLQSHETPQILSVFDQCSALHNSPTPIECNDLNMIGSLNRSSAIPSYTIMIGKIKG